jgi:hypothetical protein
MSLRLLPRCRCLASDVVKGLFTVRSELGVLEFPSLEGLFRSGMQVQQQRSEGKLTFCPYGDCPFSSLFCLTL